jgi:hypothetical protein
VSDNPGNEAPELISLGVDIDGGSFNALNAAVDALNSRIDSLIETSARLALTGDESSAAFLEQLQSIGRASLDSEQAVSDLSKQVDQLAAEYDKVAQSANQATEAMSAVGSDYNKGEYINEAVRGYGVGGGMVGPGLPGDEGGPGGGSMFGVAHAASVAGHALGAPALREAGAFLYIEEGLKRVGPLFEDLNASLEASGGLIPPLTTAFEGLGVPMAGLVASAIPVAIGVAAIGAAFLVLKSQLDEGKDAIDQAISQLDKYYAAIGSGKTSGELQSDLDKAKEKLAKDQDQFKQVSDQMLSGISQATEGQGIGAVPGMVKLLLSGGFQDLEASADKLKAALKDDQANVDALSGALGSADTAYADYLKIVHDAVEASKAQAEEETKIADLRESGTAKQVQAEMDRIKHQVDANQAQLDILSKMDQTNPDVIAAERKLIDDSAELSISYAELSGDVLELAKARDAEADAIKEQLKQMKAVEKAEADYSQAREKAIADLAAQDAAAKQHEGTAERQYTQGSLEDTEARRQIALKESREETKLKEDTANRITDIGAKLGEKQTQDILNLSRQLYDDQIKYQEGAAKYEREAQDQAVDDKKEHLAKLADLNKSAPLTRRKRCWIVISRSCTPTACTARSLWTKRTTPTASVRINWPTTCVSRSGNLASPRSKKKLIRSWPCSASWKTVSGQRRRKSCSRLSMPIASCKCWNNWSISNSPT